MAKIFLISFLLPLVLGRTQIDVAAGTACPAAVRTDHEPSFTVGEGIGGSGFHGHGGGVPDGGDAAAAYTAGCGFPLVITCLRKRASWLFAPGLGGEGGAGRGCGCYPASQGGAQCAYRRPARIAWPLARDGEHRSGTDGATRPATGLETVWATRRQRAGSLPVTVSAAKPAGVAAGAASVRVTVAGQRATARAGIHGLMLTVSGRGALAPGGSVTGGLVTGGSATVRLSYKGFAKAYGLGRGRWCALRSGGAGVRSQVSGSWRQ